MHGARKLAKKQVCDSNFQQPRGESGRKHMDAFYFCGKPVKAPKQESRICEGEALGCWLSPCRLEETTAKIQAFQADRKPMQACEET